MNIERSESASKDESTPAYLQGLSVGQRRRIHEKFETALQYIDADPPQLDRAILYLQQCIESDPAGAAYVHTYLNVLIQLNESGFSRNSGKKRGWWRRFVDSLSTSAVERALDVSDHSIALITALKLLRDTPANLTLLLMAEMAAAKLELQDTRWCLLEYAYTVGIDRPKVLEKMLGAILDGGRFEQLTDLARKISGEAKISEDWIQILSVCESHFGKSTMGDLPRNSGLADDSEVLSTCEGLRENGNISAAIRLAENAATSQASNVALKEMLDSLQIDLAVKRVDTALQLHKENLLPRGEELIDDLNNEAIRVELDIVARRAELSNQNLDLINRLVDLLMQSGNYWEAIKQIELNTIGDNPNLRLQFSLARCRQHVRQFDKAMESYEIAIQSLRELQITDYPEWTALAVEDAIQLAEAMDRSKLAVTWKEIAESIAKVD